MKLKWLPNSPILKVASAMDNVTYNWYVPQFLPKEDHLLQYLALGSIWYSFSSKAYLSRAFSQKSLVWLSIKVFIKKI